MSLLPLLPYLLCWQESIFFWRHSLKKISIILCVILLILFFGAYWNEAIFLGLIAGLVNFLQLFGNKRFFFLPLTNHLRNVWHRVSVKKNLNNSIELLKVVNKITQGHTKQILNLSSWCQRQDHSFCLFVWSFLLQNMHIEKCIKFSAQ